MSVSFDPMTITLPEDIESLVLRPGPPRYRYGDEEFAQFCAQYPDLRIEMNIAGEVIIMAPVTSEGGKRNFNLTGQFWAWAEKDGTGVGFDSSTGFTLPNGAKRSPDVSWIRRERWDALTNEQKNEFAPICPDFVVELRSKSDRLSSLQEKMEEYISNGAQLGWLIDPVEKRVHIYRPGLEAEVIANPSKISGEGSLRSFTLNLDGILD